MDKGDDLTRAGKRVTPELLIQEYISLRSESLAAKQNQQSIITWTLATTGVLFTAMVAFASSLDDLTGTARILAINGSVVLFLIGIPALSSAAFGVWLGELNRMQRAGMYLREREEAVARGQEIAAGSLDPSSPSQLHVVMWESIIGGTRYRKNWLGTIASCALFLLIALGSLTAALVIVWVSPSIAAHWGHGMREVLTWGIVIAVVAAGVVVVIMACREKRRLVRTTTAAGDPAA